MKKPSDGQQLGRPVTRFIGGRVDVWNASGLMILSNISSPKKEIRMNIKMSWLYMTCSFDVSSLDMFISFLILTVMWPGTLQDLGIVDEPKVPLVVSIWAEGEGDEQVSICRIYFVDIFWSHFTIHFSSLDLTKTEFVRLGSESIDQSESAAADGLKTCRITAQRCTKFSPISKTRFILTSF